MKLYCMDLQCCPGGKPLEGNWWVSTNRAGTSKTDITDWSGLSFMPESCKLKQDWKDGGA